MNSNPTRIRQSDTPTFWLVLILLIIVAGTILLLLPRHPALAKKQVEPEVTIHPRNVYGRTLRVVGDLDYKPFSYFHNGESEPHGYDIELVSELANRMEVDLDLQLMEWKDAVERMQEEQADLILGCDWQDASVMDCSFTIPTFEEKFVAFELDPSDSFSDLYKKKPAETTGRIPIPAVQDDSAPAGIIPRILIVDDVMVNVKVIQSMLRRLNITDVVTAENGAEALKMLRDDPNIGIVLTDMWMPVMNGDELIREIRGQEQWKDLRVYAVTADVETQKTYRESGFTGILLKPIKLAQLRSVIAESA